MGQQHGTATKDNSKEQRVKGNMGKKHAFYIHETKLRSLAMQNYNSQIVIIYQQQLHWPITLTADL